MFRKNKPLSQQQLGKNHIKNRQEQGCQNLDPRTLFLIEDTYIYTKMKCYSAIKNEILPFFTTWMDLRALCCKINEIETSIISLKISLICGI